MGGLPASGPLSRHGGAISCFGIWVNHPRAILQRIITIAGKISAFFR